MKRLIIMILLLAIFSGCKSSQREASSDDAPSQNETHQEHESEEEHGEGHLELTQSKRTELGIQTQVVVLKNGAETEVRPGAIEADPDSQALVTSQASGTLVKVHARVGNTISKGSAIAVLSSPEVTSLQSEFHEAEVEAALARKELSNKLALVEVGDEVRRPREEAVLAVAQAEAERQSVEAKLRSAVLKNERLETLLEEGIASQQQAEESRADRRALAAELSKAQVALRIAERHLEREKKIETSGLKVKAETFPAEARLARAQEKMSHSQQKLVQLGANPEGHQGLITLLSPISGTVVERPHAVGSLVAPGEKVALVVNSESIWVWLDLQRQDLNIVEQGDPVTLRLVGKEKSTVQAHIDHISPNISSKTQTYRARAVVENPPEGFALGSFVEAVLQNGGGISQAAVPEKAIQFVEGQTVVYLETPEGFVRTPVSLGPAVEDLVTVKGLEVGQSIAVAGVERLKALDLSDEIGGHSH